MTDLRKGNFVQCTFNGEGFSKSDLCNVNFNDMEFNNVKLKEQTWTRLHSIH